MFGRADCDTRVINKRKILLGSYGSKLRRDFVSGRTLSMFQKIMNDLIPDFLEWIPEAILLQSVACKALRSYFALDLIISMALSLLLSKGLM